MRVTPEEWDVVRRTVRLSVRSGLNCTIGSRNADGSVHLTPIGSLILTDLGRGFYFDIFNTQLARNLADDPRVSILAVDSAKPMWLRSLVKGGFVRPPGVRLTGTVGAPRPSTATEIRKFHRVVGPLLRTPGGRLLWGRLPTARDVRIDSVVPVRTGTMTEAHPSGRIAAATLEPSDD
jgi:hypothetical protein